MRWERGVIEGCALAIEAKQFQAAAQFAGVSPNVIDKPDFIPAQAGTQTLGRRFRGDKWIEIQSG